MFMVVLVLFFEKGFFGGGGREVAVADVDEDGGAGFGVGGGEVGEGDAVAEGG